MTDVIGVKVPASYDWQTLYNAQIDPSTVHVTNTGLDLFFTRYLIQDLVSQFEWKLPEGWDRDYFLYVLYIWGFIGVLDTTRFGTIPQACGLQGYDVFYRPRVAVFRNPLFTRDYSLVIDGTCTVIKLQPDYCGAMDLVKYYSNLMAITSEAAAVNIFNSKLSYFFRGKSQAQAESFKKMFDAVASGQPAVFVDSELKKTDPETGEEIWGEFTNNLRENYIAGDLLSDLKKIKQDFDTAVGIPNANTDKRERLITDEVNANNFATRTKAELWLEELKKGVKKTNEMFGLDISVDFRAKPEEIYGSEVNTDVEG